MKWMRNVVRALMAWMLMAMVQAHAAPTGDYVLGPGDVLKISVYQNPDLTLETRISESGVISYPLLGNVKIGGLSVAAAEKKLGDGLREGNFLKQPQVSILVAIVKGNQVSVLGAVNRPGRYPLESPNTRLSEALANAGGTMVGSGSDTVIVTGLRSGQAFRKEVDSHIADLKNIGNGREAGSCTAAGLCIFPGLVDIAGLSNGALAFT